MFSQLNLTLIANSEIALFDKVYFCEMTVWDGKISVFQLK